MSQTLLILQCCNPECALRFSIVPDRDHQEACPRCGMALLPLDKFTPSPAIPTVLPGNSLVIDALLDNIRSNFNVGSIFRTSDGAGIRRLHLCGITPTPEQSGVAKTALGADQAVPWVYHEDGSKAAANLVQSGAVLWALEGGNEATPLPSIVDQAASLAKPLVLVVGNEVSGVDPAILAVCEQRIAIPMYGVKDSLNVAVAFGIAAYFLRSARELVTSSPNN